MNAELEKLREYESRYEAEIAAGRRRANLGIPFDGEQLARTARPNSECKKAIAELTLVREQKNL